MSLYKIRAKSKLLRKLLTAIQEAEVDGLKDPLEILRKTLENRRALELEKARYKKQF